MYHLLIDTCVWIDLAKDARQNTLLAALESLVAGKHVQLILPRIIVDEFARNKDRIVAEGSKGFGGLLRRVMGAYEQFGDQAKKSEIFDKLRELDHKIAQSGDTAARGIARVEELFAGARIIEITDEVKLRAADRALAGKAPFHRAKNSMDDAVIIEVYAAYVAANKTRAGPFGFVTHNVKDFSQPAGDERAPHADLAPLFEDLLSSYFIKLGDALHTAEPELLEDVEFEQEWHEQPRTLSEILEAMDLLFDQVWYNRHWNSRVKLEQGELELTDQNNDYNPKKILRSVWKGALQAAARVEEKRGLENLGPWDDFEWGMINGKLSALRWVLGDEWDMLDT